MTEETQISHTATICHTPFRIHVTMEPIALIVVLDLLVTTAVILRMMANVMMGDLETTLLAFEEPIAPIVVLTSLFC